jgi:hypothetical protein
VPNGTLKVLDEDIEEQITSLSKVFHTTRLAGKTEKK